MNNNDGSLIMVDTFELYAHIIFAIGGGFQFYPSLNQLKADYVTVFGSCRAEIY